MYFKSALGKGYLDLYVSTRSDWPHHALFPVVGLECKVPDLAGMGWVISSRDQMRRYINPGNRFIRNGEIYPPLSICLVATPESWHEGFLYKWCSVLHKNRKTGPCCWETMTFIFQRILLKENCSILLNKRFQSNKQGGPIRNYYLGE